MNSCVIAYAKWLELERQLNRENMENTCSHLADEGFPDQSDASLPRGGFHLHDDPTPIYPRQPLHNYDKSTRIYNSKCNTLYHRGLRQGEMDVVV